MRRCLHDLRLAVSIEHRLVTDRVDRQTHDYGIYCVSMASRSKNFTMLDGRRFVVYMRVQLLFCLWNLKIRSNSGILGWNLAHKSWPCLHPCMSNFLLASMGLVQNVQFGVKEHFHAKFHHDQLIGGDNSHRNCTRNSSGDEIASVNQPRQKWYFAALVTLVHCNIALCRLVA